MRNFTWGAVAVVALVAHPGMAAESVHADRWSGCYLGGNVGGGWGDGTGDRQAINVNNATIAAGTGVPSAFDAGSSGVVGGGQVGCSRQIESFVLGIETDLQGSDIQGKSTVDFPGANGGVIDPTAGTGEEKIDWFGTLRGRVGFTLMNDLLVYGTAGLAYGGVKSTATLVFTPPADGNYAGSTSETKLGWTAGAGGEYAFSNVWSAKLEYLYVDLGKTDVQMRDPTRPGQTIGYRFQHHDNIVRAGMNYRF